jgi:uncharacterized protein (DUF305 family)
MGRLIAYTLALMIAPAFGPSAATDHRPPSAEESRSYDVQFIDMLLHHQGDGIRMAAIVEANGQRADVIRFARRWRKAQETDAAALTAIRLRSYSGAPAANARIAGLSAARMLKTAMHDLARLRTAGNRTDGMFLELAGSHGRDTLLLAADAAKRASTAELRKFAARMGTSRGRELDAIEQLSK